MQGEERREERGERKGERRTAMPGVVARGKRSFMMKRDAQTYDGHGIRVKKRGARGVSVQSRP